MTYVISGGFGDAVNQLAKAIALREKAENPSIIYIRDSHDEQILDQAKPLSRNYADWVKGLCRINGFETEVVSGDQKILCEQYGADKEHYTVLGPNMDYETKIWEAQRGLYIGMRPKEKEFIPSSPVTFSRARSIPKADIALQVRFGEEYPTKVPNASWNSVEEFLGIVKKLKSFGLRIGLFGETKQNIDALRKLVDDYSVNASVLEQYDLLLHCTKAIVFSGFGANLRILSGHTCMRMFWDPLELKLQTPAWAYPNIVHFGHEDLETKLAEYVASSK